MNLELPNCMSFILPSSVSFSFCVLALSPLLHWTCTLKFIRISLPAQMFDNELWNKHIVKRWASIDRSVGWPVGRSNPDRSIDRLISATQPLMEERTSWFLAPDHKESKIAPTTSSSLFMLSSRQNKKITFSELVVRFCLVFFSRQKDPFTFRLHLWETFGSWSDYQARMTEWP